MDSYYTLISSLTRRCGIETPLSLTLVVLVCFAAVLALVLLELDQLLLVLIGVGLSYALQGTSGKPQQSTKNRSVQRRPCFSKDALLPCSTQAVAKREPKSPVALPITRPRLMSTDFGGQVQELIAQITPGPASDLIVERVRAHVAAMIGPLFPSAHVVAAVFGDISSRTAFGQAEPEVNIVANIDTAELEEWLGESCELSLHGPPRTRNTRKAALQGCLTPLIQGGGFKFRRLVTSGKAKDPKATLVAPPCVHGCCSDNVAVCFSVNGSTPLRHAAVVADCSRICKPAKPLILLVKHWARNRSLCHANALSPYAWALLVVHFLQVGRRLIPPLRGIAPPGPNSPAPRLVPRSGVDLEDESAVSVADLFAELISFYAAFPWGEEAVSLRRGDSPSASSGGSSLSSAPTVEDPFEPGRNVAEDMRVSLVPHLHKELLRARELLASGASLEVLTEPWEPPAAMTSVGS